MQVGSASDIAIVLGNLISSYQKVSDLNPPASVATPLGDIITLMGDLKSVAEKSGLEAIHTRWSKEQSHLEDLFASYKAAGTAVCG
ncbi:MAG: hypothetical protein FWF36_02070 [Propionibacteriaceae bacterium]|nr:hypothetical protein [Propionibacteriaceae bacterium]